MEIEIDVGQCFRMLIKHIWAIFYVTVIFGLIGIALTMQPQYVTYEAISTVYSAAEGSYTNSIQGAYAMQDYMEIANSQKVCDSAAQIIGDENITGKMIMDSTSASINEDSYIMSISATSTDPTLAVMMSSALANAFAIEMQPITGSDRIQVLDEAKEADVLYNSARRNLKIRLLFIGTGFLLSCFFIVVSTVFNKKVQTIRECKLNGTIPVIGVIPSNNGKEI